MSFEVGVGLSRVHVKKAAVNKTSVSCEYHPGWSGSKRDSLAIARRRAEHKTFPSPVHLCLTLAELSRQFYKGSYFYLTRHFYLLQQTSKCEVFCMTGTCNRTRLKV